MAGEGDEAPVPVESPLLERLLSLCRLWRAHVQLGADALLDDELSRLLVGFQGLERGQLPLVQGQQKRALLLIVHLVRRPGRHDDLDVLLPDWHWEKLPGLLHNLGFLRAALLLL